MLAHVLHHFANMFCWQVLSDYIVKNRGIVPGSARDAYDQYREVEAIVMSTYKACTETDTEGGGMPFTAEVKGSAFH